MAYPVQTDPTAVFGRRVLAALIDAAIIIVPVVMLVSASFEYLEVADLSVTADEFCDTYLDERGGICFNASEIDDRVYFTDEGTGSGTALYWGGTFAMLVILQGLTGWTIGKLATGVRVVQEDGRPPGLVKALLRWLLWIVDAFPYFLPLVGFIVGLTTVGHRRVGDMAAKTFVVRSSAAGSPVMVPGLTPSAAPPGYASSWGPAVAGPPPQPGSSPQWDEARGTYIQWDPAQGAWVQWDDGAKTWSPI